MSAACAPATATSPAAVPRRRLFTIFISTSICFVGGFGLRGGCTLEGPPAPQSSGLPVALIGLHRFPTRPRNHRLGRHRDAPLRRTPTLTHAVPQATKNKHFEQLEMQFSDGCCLKNTQCVSGPRMVIGAIAGSKTAQYGIGSKRELA